MSQQLTPAYVLSGHEICEILARRYVREEGTAMNSSQYEVELVLCNP